MIDKLAIFSLLFFTFGLTPVFAVTPTDSIHFDDSDYPKFIFKGTNTITDRENPSYKLDGVDDYMILDSNLPEKLKEFSISVWVKPDFKVGIPAKLSILSQPQSFDLSINNDHIEKNFVTFSVYDGIKWHSVTSKSEINDSWTHIATTFTDESISIFVNGLKENSQKINGDYSLTHQFGVPIKHSNDYLNSKSKVLVGSSVLLRDDRGIKNNFSGQIDDILLYDSIISIDQISTLYQNYRLSYEPIVKNVEQPKPDVVGVVNIYGFIIDPRNLDDQKIQELAYVGYKIPKQSSDHYRFLISENTIQNQQTPVDDLIPNPNNQFSNFEEGKKSDNDNQIQSNKKTESNKPVENKITLPVITPTNQFKLCHFNGDGTKTTLTYSPMSKDRHLAHGDELGECIE